MQHRLLLACSFAFLVACPSTSRATSLPVGATIALSGSTGASNPAWAATSANDNNLPFEVQDGSGTVILSGNLQNRVTQSRATENLNFAPRLRDLVSPTGTARIVRLEVHGFGGFDLDVEYALDGSGEVGPDQVTRSATPGGTLDFRYGTPISPPDESRFIQIVSNAAGFSESGSVVVHVEESPGGTVFTTTIENTAAPIFIDPQRIKLVSITRESNGLITLCWNGAARVTHEIQKSPDGENWTTFRSRIVKASPACESFFPLNNPDEEYYRVIVP